MNANPRFGIVLAAGKGTRMQTSDNKHNKIIYPILGKPIVRYVLDAIKPLKLSKTICVVGYGKEETLAALKGLDVETVEQTNVVGTGDAVKRASPILKGVSGSTLVVYGDTPLLSDKTLKKMFKKHEKEHASLTILTSYVENPIGYNRILRQEKTDFVLGINEKKETKNDDYALCEIDGGVYIFDNEVLFNYIDKIGRDCEQGEISLISIVKMLVEDNKPISTYIVEDGEETFSINDRFQLAYAQKIMRKRINHKLMMAGVSIEDPDTTYISPDVEIGSDTIIFPTTTILGTCKIGEFNKIGPNTFIEDCKIGSNNIITFAHLKDSKLKDSNFVGPFSKIRGNTSIASNCRVESFVDLNGAYLRSGSEIKKTK